MQHYKFEDGSFAVHHIRHISKRKISAWYDADGELVDCEYIDNNFVSHAIDKRHHNVIDKLKRIPFVYSFK